jgi:hypothetical protein
VPKSGKPGKKSAPKKKPAERKKRLHARDFYQGYPPADLIGQRIVALRPMTKKEAEQEGWEYHPTAVPSVIELENGDVLFPVADNGGGRPKPACLMGNTKDNRPFMLLSVMESGTRIEPVDPAFNGGENVRKALPRVVEVGAAKCPR